MSGIKDKATAFELEQMPFKKIKGHTKIELTDIRDGSKKIIEHDNTFQVGVLEKYMRSFGIANNSPFANSTWAGYDLWRNLVGGIFLFRDAIDDSNGEVEYMPAGNVMVGNGCYGVSNAGNPTEFGTWNALESTAGSGGIVMVYDWGTSQGNGTIGSICLTSETGGYIGYGNLSGYAFSSKRAMDVNQNKRTFGKTGIPYNGKCYSFSVNTSTKVVTVNKYILGAENISLFHQWASESATFSYTNNIGTSTLWITKISATEVMMSTISSVSSGGTGRFLIFDLETETLSEYSISNTSGASISLTTTGSYGPRTSIFRNEDGNICFFDYSNSRILEFSASGGIYIGVYMTSVPSQDQGVTMIRMPNDLFLYSTGSYADTNNARIIDMINHTCLQTNGHLSSDRATLDYIDDLDAIWQRSGISYSYVGRLWKNPLYLATINNLDTPVTKNNTQTMKVTYTLTEVQE